MKMNYNHVTQKINQFEKEIEQSVNKSTTQDQHLILKLLYQNILEFVKLEIKNAVPDRNMKEVLVDALENVEVDYMNNPFIKEASDHEVRAARIQIQNIKWRLRNELKLLRSYLTRGLVVGDVEI